MTIYGLEQLTTRTLQDCFLQLSVQWFVSDICEYTKAVTLDQGCTSVDVHITPQQGSVVYFDFYAKDKDLNLYYKSIGFTLDASHIYYRVAQDTQYTVLPENSYMVQKIENLGHTYYIINTCGIYMLIDQSQLLANSSDCKNISIFEFNTIFPIITKSNSFIDYIDEDTGDSIKRNIINLKVKSSNDILFTVDGSTIFANSQGPSILLDTTDNYTTHINGIHMNSGVVGVSFNLAPEVVTHSLEVPSEDLQNSDVTIIDIPGINTDGIEAPSKLPLQFAGITDNATVFSTYKFTTGNPKWVKAQEYSDTGIGLNYYRDCDASWVSIPEDGKEIRGLADMKLKIDGNVSMLPVLPANTITETPEYRLFNPHFVSDNTIDVLLNSLRFRTKQSTATNSLDSGYFKLYKISGTHKEFAVVDGATVSASGKSSGPSLVVIRKNGQAVTVKIPYTTCDIDSKSTVVTYLSAYIPESKELNSMTEEELLSCVKLNFTKNIENIDFGALDTKYIVIGRTTRQIKTLKFKQDHIGIAYFDFTTGGDVYNGSFSASLVQNSSDESSTLQVSGGEVRIINRQYAVSPLTVTAQAGVVYIHASMSEGTATAVLEVADTFPTDDDTNSYYKIGIIAQDSAGNLTLTQEHHGGTPLFLFFSADCY